MIGRSLRAGINLYALNGLTFIVDCDVIKADGGTRTTAITGSWIALCLALNKYFNGSIPPEVFKSPFIGAVSVGLIDGEVLLDLNYEEDSKADVDLNLVGSYPSGWVEIQGTSESEPMEFDLLNDMISVGRNGLKKIFKLQKEILEHNQIVYE
jgi:ribonuclease PH